MKQLKIKAKNSQLFLLSFGFAFAIVSSGCGGTAYREGSTANATGSVTSTPGTVTGTTGTPVTTTPVVTVTPTPTPVSALPTETYSFSINGDGGVQPVYTTPEIDTDSVLKVKITPNTAKKIQIPPGMALAGQYSNFTANYACINFTVSVLGDDVQTQTLQVAGQNTYLCPQAAGDQTIDFSYRLTPGHGPITVQVSEAQYDYYCNIWELGWVYGSYYDFCPLRDVYKTHTVTGTLEITVDGD